MSNSPLQGCRGRTISFGNKFFPPDSSYSSISSPTGHTDQAPLTFGMKLDEKRARPMEKMQNEAARTHRKEEEQRASAEAKRGMKVARVLEVANLLRAVGRALSKRSFF